MKNITLLVILTLIFSCVTDKKEKNNTQSNIVTNFLNDVKNLEKEDSKKPIIKFQEIATLTAEKVITINKEIFGYLKTHTYT